MMIAFFEIRRYGHDYLNGSEKKMLDKIHTLLGQKHITNLITDINKKVPDDILFHKE